MFQKKTNVFVLDGYTIRRLKVTSARRAADAFCCKVNSEKYAALLEIGFPKYINAYFLYHCLLHLNVVLIIAVVHFS